LITPCLCKGSTAFVHVGCLKQWVETKTGSKAGGDCQVYHIEQNFCEICKKVFPKKVIVNQREHLLLRVMGSESPFLGLRTLNPELLPLPEQQLMYVTVPELGRINIGRLEENHIYLLDNSVSRKHARVYFDEYGFRLTD
jgi:hypothetical protein